MRRADGHWNLEELVERTSQASPAPTAKPRPEARPRFPYVEASSGRINFKLGEVKKAFAFTDADFALWLESENQWGVRLEGRPVRTDVNISDTGTLKLDGRFQRAANLRDTIFSSALITATARWASLRSSFTVAIAAGVARSASTPS